MNTIEQLNALLSDRNMSLYEFCKASGIPYSTLSRSGKRNCQLSVDTIDRICEAIKIPTYEFFMTDKDWDDLDNRLRSCRHDGRAG